MLSGIYRETLIFCEQYVHLMSETDLNPLKVGAKIDAIFHKLIYKILSVKNKLNTSRPLYTLSLSFPSSIVSKTLSKKRLTIQD